MQAEENWEAISSLSGRVDALQKSMDALSGLSDKVIALDSQMSELLTWKTHTDDRLQALETWKCEASSTISQTVSASRFDAFVQSRFTDIEKKAHASVTQSASVDEEEGQPSVGFGYAKNTFRRLRHQNMSRSPVGEKEGQHPHPPLRPPQSPTPPPQVI